MKSEFVRVVAAMAFPISIPLTPTCRAADGGTAGAVVEGLSALVAPIVASLGSADVTMELYRYDYKATTSYRGVNSASTWVAQTDNLGKVLYTRRNVMTGVESSINTVSHDPFTVSIGGSEGDIPFSLRSHQCIMPLQNGEFFTATTDSRITFKTTHRYKVNPAVMSTTTTTKITCTLWHNDRSSCGAVYGSRTETFYCDIANNGISYPSIPNSNPVNLTHGSGSGLGITW